MFNHDEYESQNWELDFSIGTVNSSLSESDAVDFEPALREALTANDNFAVVEFGDYYLSIYGNKGGDLTRARELVDEMTGAGCEVFLYTEEDCEQFLADTDDLDKMFSED